MSRKNKKTTNFRRQWKWKWKWISKWRRWWRKHEGRVRKRNGGGKYNGGVREYENDEQAERTLSRACVIENRRK